MTIKHLLVWEYSTKHTVIETTNFLRRSKEIIFVITYVWRHIRPTPTPRPRYIFPCKDGIRLHEQDISCWYGTNDSSQTVFI